MRRRPWRTSRYQPASPLIVPPMRLCGRTPLTNLAQRIAMTTKHSLLLAAVCALLLPVVACSSSSSEKVVIPEGDHHTYVVSKVSVIPPPGHDSIEYGLDLGSAKSAKLDG